MIYRYLLLFIFIFCFTSRLFTQLISYEKVASFSKEQMVEKWKKSHIPRFITPVKKGVDVYNVFYYTSWDGKNKVKASGMYFVPQGENPALPQLIYNHGTVINPNRKIDYNGESQICFLFATDGYRVLAPDYVGLGYGEKMHLYIHAESEGNAGVDLLKAVEEINTKEGWLANEQLFVAGYSQGGHATLAVHRKLQQEYSDQYTVTASSPMSGPYDLVDTQGRVMWQEYTQPHYLPYLLIGYNEFYHLWPKEDFYSIFAPPYDTLIPQMFDGRHSVGDVNEALPSVPKNMLREDVAKAYIEQEHHPFKDCLRENCVADWKPEAPVQLCYCTTDEEVMAENSLVAAEKMKARGADRVLLQRVSRKYNHRQCADFAVIHTKFFFDSFKKGSKKGRKGPVIKRIVLALGKALR